MYDLEIKRCIFVPQVTTFYIQYPTRSRPALMPQIRRNLLMAASKAGGRFFGPGLL
jgi:hypothetical protein